MQFEHVTVSEALERSIAAAEHLTQRDAAAVAAARALARKIDAWDLIVEWALEDVEDGVKAGRPAVPLHDNTSLPTLRNYLDTLGLVPLPVKEKPGPASTASPSQKALNDMRAGLRAV